MAKNKNKNKNKNKALDSNIVFNLYNIYKGIKPEYEHQNKDFVLSVYHLYDLVEQSEFNFYITTSVFSEISDGVYKYGHDEGIFDFIREMGILYISVPDVLETQCDLIYKTYIGKNNNAKYLDKAFSRENASDARIMAEATVLGLDIITNNSHHFIGHHKDADDVKHKILRINNALGYTQGVPNTSETFIKRSVPELIDKYGRIAREPHSLTLAPLDKPRTPKKRNHKNKYAEYSKIDNIATVQSTPEESDIPTEYHDGDFPTEYHANSLKKHFLNYDNSYDDDDFESEPPTN